jgi:hypothetical protein
MQGLPVEIFSAKPGSPESRSLGLPGAELLSVSRSGELAVSLKRRPLDVFRSTGTLARVPLSGGAPREILEDVQFADWAPDGARLAVVRSVAGRNRLEFPAGKALYETAGWIGHPRFSPRGDTIAFLDHPIIGNDIGRLAVIDLNGRRTAESPEWASIHGCAWTTGGDEVWYAASTGFHREIHALKGKASDRVVLTQVASLTLLDISAAGRLLVTQDDWRAIFLLLPAGEEREKDLSWLDTSVATDISDDGKTLLIAELGEAGGPLSTAYVRPADGSPAVRIGEGLATALSRDGKRVIAVVPAPTAHLVLYPTGPGEPRSLEPGPIAQYQWAAFSPDGARVVFVGNEAGRAARLYVQEVAGGAPHAISPEGAGVQLGGVVVSPDGSRVAGIGAEEKATLYAIDGEPPRALAGLEPGDVPIRWSSDGRFLFVYKNGPPTRIYRYEMPDGPRQFWRELPLSDGAGVRLSAGTQITPDGRTFAYTFGRFLSDLYLVEGAR